MVEKRPAGYPQLTDYTPTKFMLPTSHYDAEKADRAVRFIENLKHTKGRWARKRFWLLPWHGYRSMCMTREISRLIWRN